MYSIERHPKGKINRYFLPSEINPKTIMKAIRSEEERLSPNKHTNQIMMEKITE